MGQAKKLMMEYEQNLSFIDDFLVLLSENQNEDLFDSQVIKDLYEIREMINKIELVSYSNISFISDLFTENFHTIFSDLNILLNSDNSERMNTVKQKKEFYRLIKVLKFELVRIKNTIKGYINEKQSIYNSEKYYNEQIKELEKQKNELKNYLIQQKNIVGQSKEELALHKKEIQEKEITLIKANEQIKSYQKELEEKKKQENAIVEWNSKIKSTFRDLTECLIPIKNEHSRMNIMFWIYSCLITIFLIAIVLLEINIFCKLNETSEFPEWKNYFTSLIPFPILGGLLWAFIIQLNRTQRHLVVLAKHIHEIRYVEGLLLSINSLSPDINDSTKRVNIAVDRLLENHLNASSSTGKINEDFILKEEKKDSVPYDLVVKLLKDAKEIIGK